MKYFIILVLVLASFLSLKGQTENLDIVNNRGFKDVPYDNKINTVDFIVLDINLDNNLVAFKHVYNLRTTHDEMGDVHEQGCNCNYTGMSDNSEAGVVLGVYDLSTQEYLETFIIYKAAYNLSDCYDYETSISQLNLAKQYFTEHNLDISKKPQFLSFSDDKLELDGISFSYTNERTMNDDMSEMITISNLIATGEQDKSIYTVYQDDIYYMASGGVTSYISAYRQDDKIVFLSLFEHMSAMAGEPGRETYQFSPVFEILKLK